MVAVSSTLLRRVVAAGRVEDASKCLGRPYALVGQVVHGAGEGRKMGYPTINLEVAEQLIPAEGVYAGWADIAGMHRPAAISVGTRPTLGGGALVVEAFVLEETGDWYASTARLEFVARLRDQRKFASREDLTAQITQDIAKVRALTAREPIA
jgi:riboflavin kinase / FMN adenylyltransferase